MFNWHQCDGKQELIQKIIRQSHILVFTETRWRKNEMIISRIKISILTLLGVLLSFAIMYTYGNSMTSIYGAIELLIAFFCYLGFFQYLRRIDANLGILCLFVIFVAWISGILSGDL